MWHVSSGFHPDMKRALITGVTGQDGSYMAELLLSKGYVVYGTTRGGKSVPTGHPVELPTRVELIEWDLDNERRLGEILANLRPAEIYNFAAYTSGAGMYQDPVGISAVNGLAVTKLLEAIKTFSPETRFCQASSREIFGIPETSPQNESTKTNPRSPYGAAKLYADSMVRIYRSHYGLFASSAILFNHESPRRGIEFVTKKIVRCAVEIKLGVSTELRLGNLDARRDWGYAEEYVAAMWLMLQQDQPGDFVLATGQSHSVREFCEAAFGHLGLDWRDYLVEDKSAFRGEEHVPLVGDASRARELLGWNPKVTFLEMVRIMVDAEFQNFIANRSAADPRMSG